MDIINGNLIAEEIRIQVRDQVAAAGLSPHLAIVVVGDYYESLVYIGLKDKAVSFIGGKTSHISVNVNVSKETLLQTIQQLNDDPSVDGILLQLPLPDTLANHTEDFLAAISPLKDVDGFHPLNQGRLIHGNPYFVSCAALACQEVIHRCRGSVQGRHAVLVGDSFDLIQPLAALLLKEACQVTIIPQMPIDKPLPGADYYIIEKGRPEMLRPEQIVTGSLVLDGGFHWHLDHMCGNVDRNAVAALEGDLLPVPGGLGPILIAQLVRNLLQAAQRRG